MRGTRGPAQLAQCPNFESRCKPRLPNKKKNNPLPDQKEKRKDLRAFFFYNQEKICDLHNVGRGPFIFGPRQRAKADKEQDNFKYGPKGPT